MVIEIICYATVAIALSLVIISKKRADANTIKTIKKYTFLAVVEAQQIFGRHTGDIKRDYVIAKLSEAFPSLFRLLNDDEINDIIAQAKEKLKAMMDDNQYITDAVNALMNDITQEDKDGAQ